MTDDEGGTVPLVKLEAALKEYIDQRDTAVESRIKLWLMSAVMAQIVALLPVIFFLGGIYQNMNDALGKMAVQQTELARRGQWMQDRESWEQAVEAWAEPKGFRAPIKRRHLDATEN